MSPTSLLVGRLALCALLTALALPSFGQAVGSIGGVLEDTTGAIIPNATVELDKPDGAEMAHTTTDSSGHFRLQPAPGDYRLKAEMPGFDTLLQPVHSPTGALVLKMNLASVATTVNVNADEAVDVAATENNSDAASMSSTDIKSLPILDGDVVATLEQFLDTGAAGEGGATLVIDGVEMKSLGIAPEAIDRVSINQNPYSVQYRQPGRGQVEIVTKQTQDKFHGSASILFRNSDISAKNYFATVKPPSERQTYEGFLTGPIRTPFESLRNTTFLLSALEQILNNYEQVDATVPAGMVGTGNVLAPFRNTQLTMKVAHQINDHHSAFLLYRLHDASSGNENVGGQNLQTAGFTEYIYDMDLTFHDDLEISATKLNQFNILFERNIDRIVSNSQTPSIQVQGAFNGGGAQQDQFNTENNPNISDIFSWTAGPKGMHQMKFGIQIPNLSRRILEDNTNRQGTYTFASLAAFMANTPNTFTLQQGQTKFETLWTQMGVFALDEIRVNDRLSLTPGLRYDYQNSMPNTHAAFQPRMAVAYVLDKDHGLVVRTGGGIYMRFVGANLEQQLARYQNAAERNLLITTNLCYPDITQCNTLSAQPPSLYNYQPGLHAPFQGYFGVSLERELTKKSTVTLGYEGYRGWQALRSVDINAPLPPFVSYARPNPAYSQILQQQAGGTQKSDALVASYRGRLDRYFSGFAQFTYQHADSNTQWSTFQPEDQYDPNLEWGRSNYDQRYRLNVFGTFYPDKPLNAGFGFYANSPMPYTITTGTDDFKTGVLNARPFGVPRNSVNGGDFQDFQLRLNYTFKLHPKLKDESPTIAVAASSFNTFNRVNFQSYDGVITSPQFMQPTEANNPRRFQFGAFYTF